MSNPLDTDRSRVRLSQTLTPQTPRIQQYNANTQIQTRTIGTTIRTHESGGISQRTNCGNTNASSDTVRQSNSNESTMNTLLQPPSYSDTIQLCRARTAGDHLSERAHTMLSTMPPETNQPTTTQSHTLTVPPAPSVSSTQNQPSIRINQQRDKSAFTPSGRVSQSSSVISSTSLVGSFSGRRSLTPQEIQEQFEAKVEELQNQTIESVEDVDHAAFATDHQQREESQQTNLPISRFARPMNQYMAMEPSHSAVSHHHWVPPDPSDSEFGRLMRGVSAGGVGMQPPYSHIQPPSRPSYTANCPPPSTPMFNINVYTPHMGIPVPRNMGHMNAQQSMYLNSHPSMMAYHPTASSIVASTHDEIPPLQSVGSNRLSHGERVPMQIHQTTMTTANRINPVASSLTQNIPGRMPVETHQPTQPTVNQRQSQPMMQTSHQTQPAAAASRTNPPRIVSPMDTHPSVGRLLSGNIHNLPEAPAPQARPFKRSQVKKEVVGVPAPSAIDSNSVDYDDAPPLPSYRADACLGGSSKLDNYFGLSSTTKIGEMKSKRARHRMSQTSANHTRHTSRTRAKSISPPHVRDASDEEEEEKRDSEIATRAAHTAPAAAMPSSDPFVTPYDPVQVKQFVGRFSGIDGYSGRARLSLKRKYGAIDLTEVDSRSIELFVDCIQNSIEYTISTLHPDQSTNFRAATNDQRDFWRKWNQKRKCDADEAGFGSGVKPTSLVVFDFYRQKSGVEHQAGGTIPLLERDVFQLDSVNPYPYQANDYSINLERSGLFIMRMTNLSTLLPVHSPTPEYEAHLHHEWRLRQVVCDLLFHPPPMMQSVIFDAKTVVCSLMNHFHISSLPSIDILPQLSDAFVTAWLIDPDDHRKTKFNIDKLVGAYVDPKRFSRISVPRIFSGPPGDRDLDVLLQDHSDMFLLHDRLCRLLEKDGLLEPYVRQEKRMLPVVIDLQLKGITLNRSEFDKVEQGIQSKLERIRNSAIEFAADPSINLASSDQVSKVLYRKLNAPPPKLIDKGRSQAKQKTHPTTNNAALKHLVTEFPPEKAIHKFAQLVLEHRRLNKLLTGYVVPYGKSVIKDGHLLLHGSSSARRICPSWNQCATGTGRLSCRHPNLQALPRATQQKPEDLKEDSEEPTEDHDGQDEHEQVNTKTINSSPIIDFSTDGPTQMPIHLPTDINMRASIVPTPSHVVREVVKARLSSWHLENGQLTQPSASELDHLVPVDEPRCLLSADYSQMEVRILAQLAKDPGLQQVFQTNTTASDESSSSAPAAVSTSTVGGDVYRSMASIMFNTPVSSVTDAQRTISKTILLGVMYGMGSDSLAGKLTKFLGSTVTKFQGDNYIHQLLTQFPGIKQFMIDMKTQAANTGSVPTLVGRRRYLPDINSPVKDKKAYAERQAVNTVIQGSAADMMKMAMIVLRQSLNDTTRPYLASVWLILQLHDEIILELPVRLVDEVASLVKASMEHIIPSATVEFTTNIEIGPNLGEMRPYQTTNGKSDTMQATEENVHDEENSNTEEEQMDMQMGM